MFKLVKPLCFFITALLTISVTQVATAQSGYKLGVGDLIELTVYGQPDLSLSLRVDDSGSLHVPLLGTVLVAGHSSADTAKRIAQGLERGGFLQNAHVNVLVTEYRSQSVSVLGMVNRPGRLYLDGPTSINEAIAWAGGITAAGSQRAVLIRVDAQGRQSKQEFNLQESFDQNAANQKVPQLQHGDTLYVPVADRFYVRGAVNNPGMYVLDRPLNVMQAISIGGGISDRGSKSGFTLFRRQADGKVKEISAKLDDPILDGDVLAIKESMF